ncbi:alpha/beta hydrolase [Devosia sp.]|uniref:alpha/beta hydrolase n=1 Tax=Devosia sp. TaxID=1871048 RepID=UPI001ACD3CA9|nr:alpha/beta hydrolase [Devosia sp.]MBN9310949.1 alpha/beta hydrolase [Devosia sp.]
MRRVLYWLAGLAVVLVVGYVAVIAYFYIRQRDFQYDREGKVYAIAETTLQRTQVVSIRTADGSGLLGWYAPPTASLPTILYFRGKTGSFSREYARFEAFEAAGYGFLAFDYRGFPGSPGELTEENVLADSLAAFDWLQPKGGKIVLWGRSLGSGPATYVASERDAAALVLESPFRSAVAVAEKSYGWLPVSLIMLDQYPVERWIRAVQEPVFVGHGTLDPAIDVSNGRRVFELAPHGVTLWIDPEGDHDNLWDHGIWQKARAFIASST